jgi:hypothetical protein
MGSSPVRIANKISILICETPAHLKAIFLCYESQNKSPEILVNVSGLVYNTRMTTKWTKYTSVCPSCDALDEYTTTFNPVYLTCKCGTIMTYLSVEDVTIQPTETKEEKMEETTDTYGATVTPAVPDTYNPNLLVTYKVIKGYSDPEYATDKVASIEWDLHNARQTQKSNAVLHDKIDSVKNIITESFADSDDQETLRDIAEALGIELTKTVEWTATIEVSGTIELDILQEYDVESELYDNLYVDSQNGQIEIIDTEVTSAREC